MIYIFWISLFTLFCVYIGYYLLLAALVPLFAKRCEGSAVPRAHGQCPSVSVIVVAHNEEAVIASRIENLLALDYPAKSVEYIVASDGSTDHTVEVAQKYSRNGVGVFGFAENRGRAITHNHSVRTAKGDIVVFTDAETRFDPDFLRRVVEPFTDPHVGGVVGNLYYQQEGSYIAASEGIYWRFEKKLRILESKLGILATATGACTAVRKGLWRDLTPIDDVDFTTPLDILLQGHRMHFSDEARAYDTPSISARQEYKVRVRQTSKNLRGTILRWGLAGWYRHPLASAGLVFHKILRWHTFIFMIMVFVANLFLLGEGWPYAALFVLQSVFYATAVLGGLFGSAHPLLAVSFSFCVANAGMMVGVMRALTGRVAAKYKRAG